MHLSFFCGSRVALVLLLLLILFGSAEHVWLSTSDSQHKVGIGRTDYLTMPGLAVQ